MCGVNAVTSASTSIYMGSNRRCMGVWGLIPSLLRQYVGSSWSVWGVKVVTFASSSKYVGLNRRCMGVWGLKSLL